MGVLDIVFLFVNDQLWPTVNEKREPIPNEKQGADPLDEIRKKQPQSIVGKTVIS